MRSSSGLSTCARAHRPRVEDDRAHLRRPGHVGEVGRAQLVGRAPAGELDLRGLDPRRHAAGRDPLLEEHLPLDALGEALQGGRPVPQRAQDAVADGEVVLEDVALGVTLLREETLSGLVSRTAWPATSISSAFRVAMCQTINPGYDEGRPGAPAGRLSERGMVEVRRSPGLPKQALVEEVRSVRSGGATPAGVPERGPATGEQDSAHGDRRGHRCAGERQRAGRDAAARADRGPG